ncbi:MAG TPA: hypothetical protein VFR85_00905 [Anaeromyxobacteraceae bacterium]|nr:hypothetical protein [Anaeromyxobacteraceae bacterium]
MTALLALALAAAPGCPDALAATARLEAPADLAPAAPAVVARLVDRGAGGPANALEAEAAALAEAAGEGDLAAAAARFRARLARHCALAAQRPARAALRSADRRALDEILSRPEFREARADRGAIGRWLSELWRRILDLLGTDKAGRYAAGGRTLFFAAVAMALAAVLALMVRRRSAAGRPRPAAAAPPSPGRPEASEGTPPWERLGVRDAFRSLLGLLERNGRIPRRRALTNRELAVHLAAAPSSPPGLASAFADLAYRFDRTVYGGVPMAGPDVVAFSRQLDRVRTLAGARS